MWQKDIHVNLEKIKCSSGSNVTEFHFYFVFQSLAVKTISPMHHPKAHPPSVWTVDHSSCLQFSPLTTMAPHDLNPHPTSERGAHPPPPPPTAGVAPWIRKSLSIWPNPGDSKLKKWRNISVRPRNMKIATPRHHLQPTLTANVKWPLRSPPPPQRSGRSDQESDCRWVFHSIPLWWPIQWSHQCWVEWVIMEWWTENHIQISTR